MDTTATLAEALKAQTGRFADKSFDWEAFPSNVGFPDLERAQMRFIGAGGSPKVDDVTTLKPEHFTLSLIYKKPGKFAACHRHEIEESFLVIDGELVVGWEQDGEVVEVTLGPKDMILNARDVPHGFRVDGEEPVLMSISVDVGKPMPPVYHCHPKDNPVELARRFGARPGNTLGFEATGSHPLQRLMAPYVIRHETARVVREAAGFERRIYVGDGGVDSETCRKEMLTIPAGAGVAPFARDVEDAFLVLEGELTVGWEREGAQAETVLGPRDVIQTPASRAHWFRNDGAAPATVWYVVGDAGAETVSFVPASP